MVLGSELGFWVVRGALREMNHGIEGDVRLQFFLLSFVCKDRCAPSLRLCRITSKLQCEMWKIKSNPLFIFIKIF